MSGEATSPEISQRPWRLVARLIAPHRVRTAGVALGSLLGGATEAVFLVLVTRAALAIADGADSFGALAGRSLTVRAAILLAVGLLVVRLVLALGSLRLGVGLSIRVSTQARRRFAGAYLRSSWAVQQAEPPGRLQELLVSFAGTASRVVGAFASVLNSALNLVALLGVSLLINPIATAIVIGALVVLGVFLAPLRRRIRARAATAAHVQIGFATAVSEVGSLGMEMQAFGVRDQFVSRLDHLIGRDARASRSAALFQGALPPSYTFLAYGALLGGLAVSAAVASSELSGVAAVLLVMLRSLGYGQQMQTSMASMLGSMPYLDLIDEALERFERSPASGGDTPIDAVGDLELQDVSFAYSPDRFVLHDLNISIAQGEVVGVIGPSGSGKSTLVQLLLGLRDPTIGRVLVGEHDLRDVDRTSWTRRVAFVPQDAVLMSATVADNIRFFRDRIDLDRVERAAAEAHVADEIRALAEGFETDVGQRGGRLSGGQRQRVSIARALAGDPELLIMDEPTSSLDVRSESLIRSTLSQLKGRATIVIIAHRMSTLEVCDRILVLQEGRVRALDTPEALARNDQFYREALALSGISK